MVKGSVVADLTGSHGAYFAEATARGWGPCAALPQGAAQPTWPAHVPRTLLPFDLPRSFVSEAPRRSTNACPMWPTARTGLAGWPITGSPSAWPEVSAPRREVRAGQADPRRGDGGDRALRERRKGIRRPGDPHLRVKEMGRDGVDAGVIYGIFAVAAS